MNFEIMLIDNILYRVYYPEEGEPYAVPIPNEELADFQNINDFKILNTSDNQTQIYPVGQNEINQCQYMPNEQCENIQNEYQNSIDDQYLCSEINNKLPNSLTENNELNHINDVHLSNNQPFLPISKEMIDTYVYNRPFFIADKYGDLIQDFPCNKRGRPRKNPEKQTPINVEKKSRGRPRKNETFETLIKKPKCRQKHINSLDCKTEAVDIENWSKTEAVDIENWSKTEAVDIEILPKPENYLIEFRKTLGELKQEIEVNEQILKNAGSKYITKYSNSLSAKGEVTKKEPKSSYTNVINQEPNSLTNYKQIKIENIEIKTEQHNFSYENVDIEDFDFLKNFAYDIFSSNKFLF